jgi:DNA invertase Pin-like site-specific DNA recombinase
MAVRERAALQQTFRDALAELDSAAQALQEHLQVYRGEIAAARAHSEAGGSIRELTVARPEMPARSTKESLRMLEAARTRTRHAMYRLAAADGMRAAEIGRTWGVSRQLVSRVINDSENPG